MQKRKKLELCKLVGEGVKGRLHRLQVVCVLVLIKFREKLLVPWCHNMVTGSNLHQCCLFMVVVFIVLKQCPFQYFLYAKVKICGQILPFSPSHPQQQYQNLVVSYLFPFHNTIQTCLFSVHLIFCTASERTHTCVELVTSWHLV